MTASCPHFGVCGGCQIQDRPYPEQLSDKEAFVRAQLKEFSIDHFHPILPSPVTTYYRNKMEYSFGDDNDLRILNKRETNVMSEKGGGGTTTSTTITPARVHLGLHPKGRFALVTPTFECLLQSEEARAVMRVTADWATRHKIPVYVRKNHSGLLRHLVIREGKNTGERMVNLFAAADCPHVDQWAADLKASGVSITTCLWTVPSSISDVAHGDVKHTYWGAGSIQERIGRVTYKVTPQSFMQTNTRASERMIAILSQWMEDAGGVLFDLYCGSGAIGLNLAGRFREVVGIESNPVAVKDAISNAEQNGISSARFFHGQVERLLSDMIQALAGQDAVVVVDPPRAGLHPDTVEALLQAAPRQLFYVSCNPESLARDLRRLGSKYRILDVQPMDFFPHTNHVEMVVRLLT